MNPITYLLHRLRSIFSPFSFRLPPSAFGSHRLSDEERLMAFSVGLDDEPLWWRGLQELLADAEADQVELVSAATVADKPGLLAHCAGGLDMIRTVRQELERRRQESIRQR
ncbi:MAG: hypothetical protein EBR40_08085 [Proteobacteria bacterium]|nr:hypothetical protein [Pseudomonadota bacterium]